MLQKQIEKISKLILERDKSLFYKDFLITRETLNIRLEGSHLLVIGGAGTIGTAYILELINQPIKKICIVDRDENALAALIRTIRSSGHKRIPKIKTFSLDYGNDLFNKFFKKEGPFQYVANFAAHKHVRSEGSLISSLAMLENNILNQKKLLDTLSENEPDAYFSISTDKADRPASIMGASKKLMEKVILGYRDDFKISSARFPNVLFSKGSLLDALLVFYENEKPLPCPLNVKRYFISRSEAAHICIVSHFSSESGDIFIPKLNPEIDLRSFEWLVKKFLEANGFKAKYFHKAEDAIHFAIDSDLYPVLLSKNDTSGEKNIETFYSEKEIPNWDDFNSLGRINAISSNFDYSKMCIDLKYLLKNAEKKEDVYSFLRTYLDDFSPIIGEGSLDDKL